MNNFLRMIRDESGASAAEYALILAIIGTGIAIAAIALGSSISDAMQSSLTALPASAVLAALRKFYSSVRYPGAVLRSRPFSYVGISPKLNT
jgi:pilus assembly protein Flp/PilA